MLFFACLQLLPILTSLAGFVYAIDVAEQLPSLQLSAGANIYLRGTEGYARLTKRWSAWRAPESAAVVEAATTEDVAKAVKFCGTHDIPFSAQSGGHGDTAALGKLQNGVQINLRKLSSATISSNGTFVTAGGGITGKELRDYLWTYNKQTVHGLCECVGLLAPALGGGHGVLQGKYGLMSDQVIAFDVVLGNGSEIRVSAEEHKELFWAMQGAGHNFGIVTPVDYKIYPVPDTGSGGKVWSYEVFTFEATEGNVRKVYGAAKQILDDGSQPDGLKLYGLITKNPSVSQEHIILHHVVWNGPLSSVRQFTQTYHELEPIAVSSEEGTWLDVPRWLQDDQNSIPCSLPDIMPGAGVQRSPVDVKTYNIDALVDAVKVFVDITAHNEAFAASFMILEQYPTQAVRAVVGSKSAVPWRENALLIATVLLYSTLNVSTSPSTPNQSLDDLAWNASKKVRQILIDGAKETGGHYSYVNYAFGGESLGEMYGAANLRKLHYLKGLYDPDNRFAFYAPLTGGIGEENQHTVQGMLRDEL